MKTLLLSCVAAAVFTAGASSARAQANLTFSGGNGTPLTLTLGEPVSYVVTADPADAQEEIVFQGLGNFSSSQYDVSYGLSGTLDFSIDGGASYPLQELVSNNGVGAIQATDAYVYNYSNPAITVGDVVVLGAGTLTTSTPFADAPPADGSFGTFIAGGAGDDVSTPGVAVPEPSSWALLGVGAGWLGLTLRRRAVRA